MKNAVLALVILISSTIAAAAGDGIVRVKSPHSVQETVDRLEAILGEKGMKVFARINHSQGAENAGLSLKPTQQVIFGNPKVGTPLMNCQREIAVDLPQKMLIWEDDSGQVWLAYNDPQYVKTRHGVEGCDEVFKKIAGALGKFAKAAIAQ